MPKPGSFLELTGAALISAIQNKPYELIKMQKKLTSNMTCQGFISRRLWEKANNKESASVKKDLEDWFTIQEKLGHCTFGPTLSNNEQLTSSHFPQYAMGIATGILVGNRLNDTFLIELCNNWLARELYVWNLADHFGTGRVIVAGARARDGKRNGYGNPSCEHEVRNQVWQLYLGRKPKINTRRLVDAQDSANIMRMAIEEGYKFPLPQKPKLSVPLEIRIDSAAKRVVTRTDTVAGELKRGWQQTDFTAGQEPKFELPSDWDQLPPLERIGN